ncbi:hypothetical protein ETH_00036520 [Eimeria tenella]|uniref:Uncharacterized protein n=1 Tax=Eimeria tenella TaxID=5802 RepID=U6L7N2_EIMTE|nr:hypothetical protein ETH_00036520 [Eimeria tenella]CDJ44569.1 hypothetical protein ETH_00036520 [Eimeria tenella]|eukprot:XP_013235317.1 hypothetical protein ETH_00036520 [Eimeria tenella]
MGSKKVSRGPPGGPSGGLPGGPAPGAAGGGPQGAPEAPELDEAALQRLQQQLLEDEEFAADMRALLLAKFRAKHRKGGPQDCSEDSEEEKASKVVDGEALEAEEEAANAAVSDEQALLQKLEELKYEPPPGMRRVPFVETLAIVVSPDAAAAAAAAAGEDGKEAEEALDDLKREARLYAPAAPAAAAAAAGSTAAAAVLLFLRFVLLSAPCCSCAAAAAAAAAPLPAAAYSALPLLPALLFLRCFLPLA